MSLSINFPYLAMRKYGSTWYIRNTKNKQSILLKDDAADFWDFLLYTSPNINIYDFINKYDDPQTVENSLYFLLENLIRINIIFQKNNLNFSLNIDDNLSKLNNENEYNKLSYELCEISLKEYKILLTEIELTHACNFRCLHCYQPESWKLKKLPSNFIQWKNALDKLESLGVLFLIFSGGECTLLPYFRRLVSYAREKLFDVSIITNGYYLNDSLCRFLSSMNLSKITISIYGFNSDEYETFTKIPNSYHKVQENILRAKQYCLPVCARIICTKYQKKH